MRTRVFRVTLICLAALVMLHVGASAASAQDVVVTTNGDKLVGEIKNVGKDVLTLAPPYSDVDFKIKWEDVVSIQSQRQFIVETFDGRRLSGSLVPGTNRTCRSARRLWRWRTCRRSSRSTYSSGRSQNRPDFGYSIRARTRRRGCRSAPTSRPGRAPQRHAFANIFHSSQDNAPATQRWDLANDFRRLLGGKWYVNTTQDFLNSEEQGLDLRTTIGGGAGLYVMRSSSQHLAAGAGIAWTNENHTDDTPTKNSAETYFGTEFMTEKLKVTDFITRFTTPS